MALTKKAERTKAKLLQSAKKLIGEKGFDRVSVEDITRDSGVAKGTFYHYFKCKEDVIMELSFQSSRVIINQSIHLEGTVVDRCCFFIMNMYRDARWAGVRLVRQWIRECIESETGDAKVKECLEDFHSSLLTILTVPRGEGPGELVEDAPVDTLVKLLIGHIFGTLTVWCMVNGVWQMDDKTGEKYTRIDIGNLLKPYLIP